MSSRILVADDEPLSLKLLTATLSKDGHELHTAEDGEEAWNLLINAPCPFDVVILDRLMPKLDGLEILKRMKADPELRNIPVILQTSMGTKAQIVEGMQEGALYYVAKPIEPDVFARIVNSACGMAKAYSAFQTEAHHFATSIPLLQSAEFQFRTLDEAQSLATLLAAACPDPDRVVWGISELLINAIEHGNLAMGYDTKTVLTEQNGLRAEVQRRLELPEYRDRRALARFERKSWGILISVQDEGDGFDWQKFMDFDLARAFHAHGRGIAMARLTCFDGLTYAGNGNTAIATILFKKN